MNLTVSTHLSEQGFDLDKSEQVVVLAAFGYLFLLSLYDERNLVSQDQVESDGFEQFPSGFGPGTARAECGVLDSSAKDVLRK